MFTLKEADFVVGDAYTSYIWDAVTWPAAESLHVRLHSPRGQL